LKSEKVKWNAFEHFFWREFQLIPSVKKSHVLIALSGGADSIALLKALLAIQSSAKIKISAMYVHHGDSSDFEMNSYRNSCEFFCHKICIENNVFFQVSKKPERILKSEESLRDFRYQQLFDFQKQIQT
jgi:tRNA(Ile)-lysidine synthase